MVVLLGLESTCEPAIADRKKLGGAACSALDDGVQSVLNLQPKTYGNETIYATHVLETG